MANLKLLTLLKIIYYATYFLNGKMVSLYLKISNEHIACEASITGLKKHLLHQLCNSTLGYGA